MVRVRWLLQWAGLAALGVLAALAVSPIGQVLAVVSAITVIGIPLAILVVALPGLFLVLLATRLAWTSATALRQRRWRAALLGLAALAALTEVFVFRAWRVNAWLDGNADDLVAGDVDRLAGPARIGTLVVLRAAHGRWDADTACDDLCRRLLLTGAVRQVLAATVTPEPGRDRRAAGPLVLAPAKGMEGMAWRLETRERCDDPGPLATARTVTVTSGGPPGARAGPPVDSADLMRVAVAGGTCLVGQPMALAQADAILAFGEIKSAASTFSAGFNAWTDTVGAWRIAFWSGSGAAPTLEFQHTAVVWQRLPGVFVPWIEGGTELRTAHGWLRLPAYLHRTPAESSPPVGDFVMARLGLDLDLSGTAGSAGSPGGATAQARVRAAQADAVDRILARAGDPGANDLRVVQDYLNAVGSAFHRRTNGAGAEDAARVARIVAADRIGLPVPVIGAVQFAVGADPTLAPAMAAALAARLEAVPPLQPPPRQDAWATSIRAVTGAMSNLPATALQPYRELVFRLAADRDRRGHAAVLLGHLDVFGPAAGPVALAMMDDAATLRDATGPDRRHLAAGWADVWRAGALALCRLAPQWPQGLDGLRAASAPLATARLRSADEFVAAAMLRMGATEDDVHAVLAAVVPDDAARRTVDRARGSAGRDPCR